MKIYSVKSTLCYTYSKSLCTAWLTPSGSHHYEINIKKNAAKHVNQVEIAEKG